MLVSAGMHISIRYEDYTVTEKLNMDGFRILRWPISIYLSNNLPVSIDSAVIKNKMPNEFGYNNVINAYPRASPYL